MLNEYLLQTDHAHDTRAAFRRPEFHEVETRRRARRPDHLMSSRDDISIHESGHETSSGIIDGEPDMSIAR